MLKSNETSRAPNRLVNGTMGQEARTIGDTGKPADLRVLRATSENTSPLPKDFVAEVERRARTEGGHEPENEDAPSTRQLNLKNPLVVGGGALAAVIIAVALLIVGGSGSDDEAGGTVVASAADSSAMPDEASPTAVDAGAPEALADTLIGQETEDTIATDDGAASLSPALVSFGGFGADFDMPAITAIEPVALDTTVGELSLGSSESEMIVAAFKPEGSVDMPWLNAADSAVSPYWSEVKPTALAALEISASTAGVSLANGVVSPSATDEAPPATTSSDLVVASNTEGAATKSATIAAPPKGTRVQLAAYGSEERANEAWSELQAVHGDMLADLQPMVESASLESGTFYRLQAGPFESASDADTFCQQLHERQLDCIVIPR